MYFTNSFYVSFIVITLPREGRGHLLRCCTRTCEYNYNLKLCAFNVGERENSGVLDMLVGDVLEVLLVIGL